MRSRLCVDSHHFSWHEYSWDAFANAALKKEIAVNVGFIALFLALFQS